MNDGNLGLAVGDVSGKDVPGSLLTLAAGALFAVWALVPRYWASALAYRDKLAFWFPDRAKGQISFMDRVTDDYGQSGPQDIVVLRRE
jgi:hypothetical protein